MNTIKNSNSPAGMGNTFEALTALDAEQLFANATSLFNYPKMGSRQMADRVAIVRRGTKSTDSFTLTMNRNVPQTKERIVSATRSVFSPRIRKGILMHLLVTPGPALIQPK